MQETAEDSVEAPGQRSRGYYLSNVLFFGAVLVASVLLPQPSGGRTVVFGWTMPPCCPSQAVLGVNCPGCGLTRSFVCTADGDLGQAVSYNRLGPAMFVFVALIFLVNLARWIGAPRFLPLGLGDRIAAALITLLILNWAFNLCVGGWTWLRSPL